MKYRRGYSCLDLNGSWQLNYSNEHHELKTIEEIHRCFGKPLRASVPGNFELDLMDNGIIPDPYFGSNIRILRDYENKHIWYYRTFSLKGFDDAHGFIVFEGLDCIADIYLNGSLLGSSSNMMIGQEFDSEELLTEGSNEIIVHIKPTLDEALRHEYPFLVSGFQANYQSLYIRKPAHMYGWDILPRIISAGIFRPVYLEFRKEISFKECYLQTTDITDGDCGLVFFYKCFIGNDNPADYRIRLSGQCGESRFAVEFPLVFQYGKHFFRIEKPLLWHPLGNGSPNLYDIKALLVKDDTAVAEVGFRHGIRTIELVRDSGDFHFIVNGRKIFAKGTNWVAADALHSRDSNRIPRMLEMAEDLRCNIIRCWGGNLYEDDIFYDRCDELGIMVWQDFAMACAVYPQDEKFIKVLENEAVSVIKRLRQHACLALWAGDNECDQAHSWFGFDIDPNKNVLTRNVLPECVRLHDPLRSYLPSSPYIDPHSYRTGCKSLPEDHLWGKRDYYKSDYYAGSTCRFASETGYHGCPSPKSIEKFISPECIWPYDNEEWLLHSTSPIPEIDDRYNFRVELMANQIKVLFGEIPGNIDDFSLASQISQAEAKKFLIELFRGGKWDRTGIIWWNLIDGWPQFSDAVVDYYFEKKLSYDYIKRSQQDMLLMFSEPESGFIRLMACNDTSRDTDAKYVVTDLDSGDVLMDSTAHFKADSTVLVGKLGTNEEDRRFLLISWSISGQTFYNHYLMGKPPFGFKWYLDNLSKLQGHSPF